VVEINRTTETTGIRSASRPGWWVVPPWPDNASVHEIVRQFLRFDPLLSPFRWSDEDEKAFYVGYQRALDSACTDDLTCAVAWRWYDELQDCVARCVARYMDDAATDAESERERRAL
jgi:hypothetical protein